MRHRKNIRVKHKRGIPIPTRIIFSALFLLVQLAIFFAIFFNLSTKSLSIYFLSEFFGIVTVVYIINRRGNPSYKLMWAVFILVFPIFGIFIFGAFCGFGAFARQGHGQHDAKRNSGYV